MKKKCILGALFMLLISTPLLNAQQNSTTVDDLYIDFAVPDLSAFTLLGVNPQSVSRPGNVKELAVDFLPLVRNTRQISPGVAVEWAPFMTLSEKNMDNIAQYRKNQIFKRIQLTFGTAQDSLASKVAAGLKWTLIDKSDPLLDRQLQATVVSKLQGILESLPANAGTKSDFMNKRVGNWQKRLAETFNVSQGEIIQAIVPYFVWPGNGEDNMSPPPNFSRIYQGISEALSQLNINLKTSRALNDELEDIIYDYVKFFQDSENQSKGVNSLQRRLNTFVKNYSDLNWNRAALAIGAGHLMESTDFSWRALTANKLSGYVSGSIPFLSQDRSNLDIETDPVSWQGQLVGLAQVSTYYNADSGDVSLDFNAGGRILYGSNGFRISLEGLYAFRQLESSENESNLRITGGLEFKIPRMEFWLELAAGIDTPTEDLGGSSFLSFVNAKYAFAKGRRQFN